MSAIKTSRRPVRLALRRLPPEAVGRAKWGQRVLRELRGVHSQRFPPPEMNRLKRLDMLRRGFMPMCWQLYGLAENDPRDYLTDQQREMTWTLNWPYAAILDDKLGFYYVVRGLGAPTPTIYALILEGRVEPLEDEVSAAGGGTAFLQAQLAHSGRLLLKPIWGAKGKGISVLEPSGDGVLINGEQATWSDLERKVAGLKHYLVAEYVEQARYARELFAGSANSMRLLTIRDEEGAFLAAAAHRFGSQSSEGPVDSWSRGGLSAGIDMETGALTAGVTSPEFSHFVRHERHPDTGTSFVGSTVANWAQIKTGIVALAEKLPYLPYIGWDVIATDDGYQVIEGNKQSNVGFLQVHRPLLREPRVRAYYERNGIL